MVDRPSNEVTGVPTPRVAILGAGAAGLCMAMQLQDAGIHSFTIYEKSDGVGGTWRDNTYPGRRVRRALAPVQLLVRPQDRLDPEVPRAARDPGLLRVAGRLPCAAPAPAVRHRGGRGLLERRGRDLGPGARRRRARDRGRGRVRPGPAEPPEHPRHPRPGALRRHHVPLGSVGPRPRSGRRGRGRHRHRRRARSSSCPRWRRLRVSSPCSSAASTTWRPSPTVGTGRGSAGCSSTCLRHAVRTGPRSTGASRPGSRSCARATGWER